LPIRKYAIYCIVEAYRRYAVTFIFFVVLPGWAQHPLNKWHTLEPGLEYAEFKSEMFPSTGDSIISVLRIDPKYYELRYLAASEYDSAGMLLKDSALKFNLVAVINAGMYAKDYLTHIGYSKNRGRIHNKRVLKNYKSVLAFDPVDAGVPEVQLLDLQCQNFRSFENRYATLIQNIRMISCRGKNVWSRQKDKWSTAALGQDAPGRILFLFSRSPYSVHDFIEILLNLPLSLSRAMYLEGGSPAGIFIQTDSTVIQKYGLHEGIETEPSPFPQTLPNVIGAVKK